MCGIAGFVDLARRASESEARQAVERMAETLHHRGPDDHGAFVDAAAGVAFGHRRLSILDLSAHGHQPMRSRSGRYVLSYNGEIYNAPELRLELERKGVRFRGTSDTEVLVAALDGWGFEGALPRLNGMFAFSALDLLERTVHLAIDRFGEKPLYHGWFGEVFLFGSELKALEAHPAFRAEIDRDAVVLYLRHNCVPAPRSIYRGVSKLSPGTALTVDLRRSAGDQRRPAPYWRLGDVAEAGIRARPSASPEDLIDELDAVLGDAVARRLHADVPLGAFLSGGIDSSLVVALMQQHSSQQVRTFTIGSDDAAFDESQHAAAVARHLGTQHTELRVTPRDALEVVPRLPTIYDEPFADSSQIPTVLLSALTRRHVTVALSGDGADELFGGYNRHTWGPTIWNRTRRIPGPVRRVAASAIAGVGPTTWDAVFRAAEPAIPRRLRVRTPGIKAHKLAEVLPADGVAEMYRLVTSHWKSPESVVIGGREPQLSASLPGAVDAAGPAELMMYQDAVTYLPDDILVKVDRASMAASLEMRAPFLDPDVAAFSWRIGQGLKIQGTEGKWILRQLLDRYVPRQLTARPKTGFSVPVGAWLRGELRPWAEELLAERRIREQGLLEPAPVRRLWAQHLSGRRDWSFHLWDVLMLQAWLADG